jgi:hypothetical protein
MNWRPAFAAGGGRMFFYIPDGSLGCIDAATGRILWRAKLAGYGTGSIGVFGDRVVVSAVNPNSIAAYSVLNGKLLLTAKLHGSIPGMPGYDDARRRAYFVDENGQVRCYQGADLKIAWTTPKTGGNYPELGYASVRPDGSVRTLRRVRRGSQTIYEMSLYDGEKGKRKWAAAVGRYHRKGQDYERTTVNQAPVLGEAFACMPASDYVRKRENNRYISRSQGILFLFDSRTGKMTAKLALKGNNVWPMCLSATRRHLVFLSREYDTAKRQNLIRFNVADAEAGKVALSEKLGGPMPLTDPRNRLLYALRPVVTLTGHVILATGDGLACYGPADDPKTGPDKKGDKK